MTKLERDALHAMLDGSAQPIVTSQYVDKLDCPDFMLGWHLAHQRMQELMVYLLRAKPADLRRCVRSVESNRQGKPRMSTDRIHIYPAAANSLGGLPAGDGHPSGDTSRHTR